MDYETAIALAVTRATLERKAMVTRSRRSVAQRCRRIFERFIERHLPDYEPAVWRSNREITEALHGERQ
jgi:hypothetical protein